MTTTLNSARAAAGLALVAGLAVVALPSSVVPRAGTPVEGREVSPAVLATALSSSLPAERTMSDEIEHFEERLADQGDEPFSHTRLFAARLLSFRAYGDLYELEKAEGHIVALEAAGWQPAQVLSMRASLHLIRHEFGNALGAARDFARRPRTGESAWTRLFDALWASGQYLGAEELLRLPRERRTMGFLAREARLLDRLGQVERARDNFREALELIRAYAQPAPVEAWALVELGHFEHHAGDPSRAVDLYLEALEVLPGNPAALEGLAAVAYGVDRAMDAAAQLYERALQHGAHLDLVPVLAAVERERGNTERALELEADFIARATADELHLRWYRRPLTLLLSEATDRPSRCLALSHARLDLGDRHDDGAWDALAWSLYGTGHLNEAYEASLRATESGSPEPWVAYHSGVIAMDYGDGSRGRKLLRAALEGSTELATSQVEDSKRRLSGWVTETLPDPVTCGASPYSSPPSVL